jgi:proteic killer suppression protein
VIQSFADKGTSDVYDGIDSRQARQCCPRGLWPIARRKLDQLDVAGSALDLRAPPGNRLEALNGDRKGQHGVRINEQYRICFTRTSMGPANVQIVDYH